jgi:hypothetical protein
MMKQIVSDNHVKNLAIELAVNRKYGDLAMRFVVFGWLIFQLYTYYLMSDRPMELFAPINWFDKLFMPSFPHWSIWLLVWTSAFTLNILLYFKGDLKWQRIVLGVLILWINCIRWKYEFFSHVGHIMVLYHLVGIFLPRKDLIDPSDEELIDYSKGVKWLFSGLLIGYTFSGLWKVAGLVYKLILKPEQISWIHPLAMKLNSIVGYRDWDMPLDNIDALYSVLIPWQIAFVLMLLLQVFSIFGGVRQQLTPYITLGNIAFHVINTLLIHIEFYLTPIVLLAVFFPYHLVFERKAHILAFTPEKSKGIYIRTYTDGSQDNYSGFEAWREFKYDKNPLVYGVFYFPGLGTLIRLLKK